MSSIVVLVYCDECSCDHTQIDGNRLETLISVCVSSSHSIKQHINLQNNDSAANELIKAHKRFSLDRFICDAFMMDLRHTLCLLTNAWFWLVDEHSKWISPAHFSSSIYQSIFPIHFSHRDCNKVFIKALNQTKQLRGGNFKVNENHKDKDTRLWTALMRERTMKHCELHESK